MPFKNSINVLLRNFCKKILSSKSSYSFAATPAINAINEYIIL